MITVADIYMHFLIDTIPVKLISISANFGRVAVYHNGEWGRVCNDFITNEVATVICRQLGLPTPGKRLCKGYA